MREKDHETYYKREREREGQKREGERTPGRTRAFTFFFFTFTLPLFQECGNKFLVQRAGNLGTSETLERGMQAGKRSEVNVRII